MAYKHACTKAVTGFGDMKYVIMEFIKLITEIKTDKDYRPETKVLMLTEMQDTMKQYLSAYGITEFRETITVIEDALKEIRAGG